MNYARNLLLQRGREAGGIAAELADLIEEMDMDGIESIQSALADKDEAIEGLRFQLASMKTVQPVETEPPPENVIEIKTGALLQWASDLADALYLALRRNDLPTVEQCQKTLALFRSEYPKA